MKRMGNKMKSVALALAVGFGGAVSAFAQDDAMRYEEMFNGGQETESQDVLSLLRSEDDFSIFLELLEESGLEPSINIAEPVTILAPINQAFKQLPAEQYKKLRGGENKDMLIKIMHAHIFPRSISSMEFSGNQVLTTADGEEIPVVSEGTGAAAGSGTVSIGGSRIARSDVKASNGVIYVMERVIIPGQTGSVTGQPF